MINLTLAACLVVAPVGMCLAEQDNFQVPLEGWASQYAKGVTERVIRQRQRWSQLPDPLPPVDGYIASLYCNQIGETWKMRPASTEEWETFLVVDCSGHYSTSSWMLRNNILCEVDYETALRWKTIGRGIRVEVLK